MSSLSVPPPDALRPRPPARRRLRRVALEALGWVLVGVGALGAVLPLHPGAPVLVVGLIIVLRTSRQARRQFIGLKRRYPKVFSPIRRLLRRDPEVMAVAWQQVLRTERLLLPRRWRPVRALRRRLFPRRR